MIWTQPYRLTCLVARMRRGQAAWREFKMCVFAFTLNFMVIWLVVCLLARYDPDKKPMDFLSALVFSVQCGFTLACLWQLHWLAPSRIVLNEGGIAVVEPSRCHWRYDQIAAVRIDMMQKRARTFRFMRVILRDGREIVVGVPNRLDLPRVIDFLKGKGVDIAETTAEKARTVQDLTQVDTACRTDAR